MNARIVMCRRCASRETLVNDGRIRQVTNRRTKITIVAIGHDRSPSASSVNVSVRVGAIWSRLDCVRGIMVGTEEMTEFVSIDQ